MEVKSGMIVTTRITTSEDSHTASKEIEDFNSFLIGMKIYEIEDFCSVLSKAKFTDSQHVPKLARWLNQMFAKEDRSDSRQETHDADPTVRQELTAILSFS